MPYGSARSPIAPFAALAKALDSGQGLRTIFFIYAFEAFEVAAYRSLIILCDEAGFPELRPLLEQNLEEEESMASWIASNIERLTVQYVLEEPV
jgi:ferritin-like metal-binding protein YciE